MTREGKGTEHGGERIKFAVDIICERTSEDADVSLSSVSIQSNRFLRGSLGQPRRIMRAEG